MDLDFNIIWGSNEQLQALNDQKSSDSSANVSGRSSSLSKAEAERQEEFEYEIIEKPETKSLFKTNASAAKILKYHEDYNIWKSSSSYNLEQAKYNKDCNEDRHIAFTQMSTSVRVIALPCTSQKILDSFSSLINKVFLSEIHVSVDTQVTCSSTNSGSDLAAMALFSTEMEEKFENLFSRSLDAKKSRDFEIKRIVSNLVGNWRSLGPLKINNNSVNLFSWTETNLKDVKLPNGVPEQLANAFKFLSVKAD